MLSRRRFTLTAAGPMVSAALPAFARAPLVGTQVPGIFRRKVGEFEITALLDNYVTLAPDLFSGVAAVEMAAILAASGQDETLETAVNAFVINTPGSTFLVDTGTGASQAFGPTLGATVRNLEAAEVTPNQIDAVIVTHALTDHAEGLVDATSGAVFPNAELVLHEAELAFWTDDTIIAQEPEAMMGLSESAHKSIAPYQGDTRTVAAGEVFSGITLKHAPGHTPSHSVLHLASSDAELMILGDTLHNAAIHMAEPDAGFGYGNDPVQAAAPRRALFDRIAADNALIAATHISFPGFGRNTAEGERFRYTAAEWAHPLSSIGTPTGALPGAPSPHRLRAVTAPVAGSRACRRGSRW